MTFGIDEILAPDISDKDKLKALKRVWTENAEACIGKGSFETARALYFNAIHMYPTKKSLWFNAIKLEEEHGGKNNLADILTRAKDHTKHVFFYLKLAKHMWKSFGKPEETRGILREGYENNRDSEEIVLAIQKFERENLNY